MPPRSILVVDDDALLRQLIRRTLEDASYSVVEADDGKTGGRAMALQHFDLVITDLLMPEKDGLELIEELRLKYPRVRIVATSGGGRVAREEYMRMAKGLGAHVLLPKPFNPVQLLTAVADAIVR